MADLVGESPKGWQVNVPPDIRRDPFADFHYPSCIERSLVAFKFWRSRMIGGARSTGLEGCDYCL